jgi:serine/threonine-protein kinase PpkA
MKIPGYEIESKVGQGGMAMVYRAVQTSLGRTVALKILNPLYADSDEFTAQFLNEGRMLASLTHPNIIAIYDLGAAEYVHYIAMEYVHGADLKIVMRDGVSVEDAVTYVKSLASALNFAHANGIVHRDIKPSNVLFRADGTLLLSDFGIAKQVGHDSELTATGTAVGSPYYLSPEQARAGTV